MTDELAVEAISQSDSAFIVWQKQGHRVAPPLHMQGGKKEHMDKGTFEGMHEGLYSGSTSM